MPEEVRLSGNEGAEPVAADRKATVVGQVRLNDAVVGFDVEGCAALLEPLSNSKRKHSLGLTPLGMRD